MFFHFILIRSPKSNIITECGVDVKKVLRIEPRETRFKKINNTLKDKTLNGTNPPNGLDPINVTPLKNKGVTDDFRPIKPLFC